MTQALRATCLVGSGLPGVMTGCGNKAHAGHAAALPAHAWHGGETGDYNHAPQAAHVDMACCTIAIRKWRNERHRRIDARQAFLGHRLGCARPRGP